MMLLAQIRDYCTGVRFRANRCEVTCAPPFGGFSARVRKAYRRREEKRREEKRREEKRREEMR